MKTIYKHLAKVCAFLVVLFLLDRGIGLILHGLMLKVDTGEGIGKINAALEPEHRNSDLIVFGSSRARHHIDPRILDAALHIKSYNTAVNGTGIDYSAMLESMILKRGSKAKVFLLVFNVDDLYYGMQHRASMFAPYLHDTPEIDKLLVWHWGDRIKLWSVTYRYNSLLLPMLWFVAKPEEDFKGYLPLYGHMPEKFDTNADPLAPTPGTKLDLSSLDTFQYFVSSAKAAGIRVVCIEGPHFRIKPITKLETEAIDDIRQTVLSAGALYCAMDENEYPQLGNKALYRDAAHLNFAGSELFSQILAERLKPLFAN